MIDVVSFKRYAFDGWDVNTGGRSGKVDSLRIGGLDLWFNSSDHLPPHIHVRKPGEWEVRVYFTLCTRSRLEIRAVWPSDAKGPRGWQRLELLQGIEKNKSRLLEEWERKVCTGGGP